MLTGLRVSWMVSLMAFGALLVFAWTRGIDAASEKPTRATCAASNRPTRASMSS